MTTHDYTHLQQIANVLERWVNGPPRPKYGHAQREEDKERLRIIHEQLKENENITKNKNLRDASGINRADTLLLV